MKKSYFKTVMLKFKTKNGKIDIITAYRTPVSNLDNFIHSPDFCLIGIQKQLPKR